MGVAETERALSRVAEARQRQRDEGEYPLDSTSPLHLAGGITLLVGHAVEAAWEGDLEGAREALVQVASLAVQLLELSDEQLREYGMLDKDAASGAHA